MENNTHIKASSDRISPCDMSSIRERIRERIVEHSTSESSNRKSS